MHGIRVANLQMGPGELPELQTELQAMEINFLGKNGSFGG